MFEATIRTFGGLLAAYDLSGDNALLDGAKHIGQKITELTDERGRTMYTFGRQNGVSGCNTLADSGTKQVEMTFLSQVTRDQK